MIKSGSLLQQPSFTDTARSDPDHGSTFPPFFPKVSPKEVTLSPVNHEGYVSSPFIPPPPSMSILRVPEPALLPEQSPGHLIQRCDA
jgi:hypothetical protein